MSVKLIGEFLFVFFLELIESISIERPLQFDFCVLNGSCVEIVMGVGGVGKSAITNRFVINRWIEKYDPTIEESYMTNVDIDGKALQVEILDTAGQDEYAPLRETFMHTG